MTLNDNYGTKKPQKQGNNEGLDRKMMVNRKNE
jgi:hypothetical protein